MDALSALIEAIYDAFLFYVAMCFLVAVLTAGVTGTLLYLFYPTKRDHR